MLVIFLARFVAPICSGVIHDEALEYQRIGKYTKEIQDRLNRRSNKLITAYKAQVEYNKQLAEEVRELYYKRSEL